MLGYYAFELPFERARFRAAAKSVRMRVVSGTRPTRSGGFPFSSARLGESVPAWWRSSAVLVSAFAGLNEQSLASKRLEVNARVLVFNPATSDRRSAMTVLPWLFIRRPSCVCLRADLGCAGIRQHFAEQRFTSAAASRPRAPSFQTTAPWPGRVGVDLLRASARFWPAADSSAAAASFMSWVSR